MKTFKPTCQCHSNKNIDMGEFINLALLLKGALKFSEIVKSSVI